MLDIKRTGDPEYGQWIKALICGAPGSGKTLTSSTWPNPIVASAEGGLMSLAERGVPYIQIREKETLLTLLKLLQQEPRVRIQQLGFQVDTVVLDTIDEISRLLLRERCIEVKQDQPRIQDYGWLSTTMGSIVRGFRDLEMNVVFTCHLRHDNSDDDVTRIKPGIAGGYSEQIAADVDLAMLLKTRSVTKVIGQQTVRTIERVLQTYPEAPTFDWIKDRSGKLPQEIPINFEDDYDRLATFVYGGIAPLETLDVEPEGVPVEIVTTEAITVVEPTPAEPKYVCEECGDGFDGDEQRAKSKVRFRRVLCVDCHSQSVELANA